MSTTTTFQKIIYHPITRIIIGFVIVLGALMLGQFVGQNVIAHMPISTNAIDITAAAFVASLALASYMLLFRFYEKRKISELSLKSFPKNALAGLIIGLLLQSLAIGVIYLYGGYKVQVVNPISFLIPPFAVALTSGVGEELLIRGVVFRIMEERLGTVISIIISALLFGALHLANNGATIYSALSVAIEAGVLLAAAFAYSRSLWLPIALHFGWNFAEAGIYGAIISGNTGIKSLLTSSITGPNIITGGQFGPENSIQATIFCFIAGLIFLWLAKRRGMLIKPYWKKHSQMLFAKKNTTFN